jgi:SOS-response transcriptional repressor LexA
MNDTHKPTGKNRQRKETRRVRVSVRRFEKYGIERGDVATYLNDEEIAIGDLGYFAVTCNYSDHRQYYNALAFLCEQDKTCGNSWNYKRTSEDLCIRYDPSQCEHHHAGRAYGRVIEIERHGQPIETALDLRAAHERDGRDCYPKEALHPTRPAIPPTHKAEELTTQHAIPDNLITSPMIAGFTLADLLGLWPSDPAPFLFTITNDNLHRVGLQPQDVLIGFKTDDIKQGDLVLARVGEHLLVRLYSRFQDCVILGTAGGEATSNRSEDIEIVGRIIRAMRKSGLADVLGIRPAHVVSNIPPKRETEDKRADFSYTNHWWTAAWSSKQLRRCADKIALIQATGTDEQRAILATALEYRAEYSDVLTFFPDVDIYSPESLYITEYCISCRLRWTEDSNKMEQLRMNTPSAYLWVNNVCNDLLTEKGMKKIRKQIQSGNTPGNYRSRSHQDAPICGFINGQKTYTADVDLPRDGINKGDRVVVELCDEIPNACVGAVRHRCRVTINRIYTPDPDHIRIGEDYEDIEKRDHVEIIGKVVKVIKKKLPKDDDGILDADIVG